ncbi:SusC/RagA family TonB-linked outer membrane protein [Pedobacter sp.]|uniref:SusC/RagA family TonB-linked outer membrane protein n=1 Tax=Pedobacter sp. TaxID=1411316 RepID=UPI003D7FF38A
MSKMLPILLIFFLFAGHAMAQEKIITGIVTSKEDGLPMPSVSIKLKGTNVVGQTGNNGRYSIKVPGSGNPVLVFSYIGYGVQEVNAATRTTINLAMVPDQNLLNEVLVVAYGTANKNTYTGSSAQINGDDFDKRPITNVMSAVAGSAPGIQATSADGAPGSTPGIRIRGFGSISASNDALYVVDGSVFDGNISNIDPSDIESVSLLKDAATAALYGSRAGNGVVLITTKKGRSGKQTLNFKASTGWVSRGLPEYDRVDAYQYYPLQWETQRNSLAYGSARIPLDVAGGIAAGTITNYNGNRYSGIKSLLGYNPFNVPDNQIVSANGILNPNASLLYADDLDWADQAAQGGKKRQNYAISYSGGSEKSDYFGSLGYTNDEGYLINSSMKRFNGRLNVNTQPVTWFNTGLNLNGTYSKSQLDNVDDGGGTSFINPFYISRMIAPIYPVHLHDANGVMVMDQNGKPQYDFGEGRPFASGRHAIYENLNDKQNQVRGAIGARTFGSIHILPGLKATARLSFDLQDTHDRSFDNPNVGDGAPSGRAYQYLYRTTSYTFSQLAEYDKRFGKHNLQVLAGHENYSYKYNYLSGSRSGVIVNGITELVNFATVLGTTSYEDNATIESYLSRLTYDYDGKYLFSGSFRRDGNSKFSPSVRWANFWSLSAGWNINRESFFNADWVDQLKVRGSYGVLGNDGGLGYYPYQALYDLGRNNQAEAGVIQRSLSNPDLTWETSKNFDVGVDFSFFKGRLGGSAEYFKRKTDGLIFEVEQPLSNGGTYNDGNFVIPTNIGSLYNEGGELTLTGQVVKSKDFTYTTTLNLTSFKNKVTKLPDNMNLIQDGTKAYSAGHSIYDFYLREYYGVDPTTGSALYKTNAVTNNTTVIGQDTVTTILGEANYRYTGESSIPDLYGSMIHNFSYKNFNLGVQFTFQKGGKVYDGAYAALMHGGNYGTAMHVDALNRWKNPGDITDVPRFDNGQVSNYAGQSSRWLVDASYFQLNNVTLNYNLPTNWLEAIKAQSASIYVSGENLALFSKRKGMSPGTSFNGTVGNNYNFSRTISVGVNVNF